MGLLTRESGFLLVETVQKQEIIGFVRYTLIPYPDVDMPYPEIGFGIPAISARGKGYAQEAVKLLVGYLFSGYPVERIMAFTDGDNVPSQRVLERLDFIWKANCAVQRSGTESGAIPLSLAFYVRNIASSEYIMNHPLRNGLIRPRRYPKWITSFLDELGLRLVPYV